MEGFNLQHAAGVGSDGHECELGALATESCDVLGEPIAVGCRQGDINTLHKLFSITIGPKKQVSVSKIFLPSIA